MSFKHTSPPLVPPPSPSEPSTPHPECRSQAPHGRLEGQDVRTGVITTKQNRVEDRRAVTEKAIHTFNAATALSVCAANK